MAHPSPRLFSAFSVSPQLTLMLTTGFLRMPLRGRILGGLATYVLLSICVWVFASRYLHTSLTWFGDRAGSASNSTLGFGHIYVISKHDSPRRKSIIKAANVTELDLVMPVQPKWTKEDQRKFRTSQNSSISKGSLLAWLGHLHALTE